MKKLCLVIAIFLTLHAGAQADSSKWLRAFPITSYIIDLNDTVKLVQLEMPDDISIKDKQLGLVRGVYTNAHTDTVPKGYGRCQLIKGNFYYFSVGHNESGVALKAGDLLYTFMERTNIWYGQIPKIAGHFIQLRNVYDEPFYDRYQVFRNWSVAAEKTVIDSMVSDIRFTGKYFQDNDPSMDKAVTKGKYINKKILTVMTECRPDDVKDFLSYVITRPRLYAGKEWKISEVFATWASEGAPVPVYD